MTSCEVCWTVSELLSGAGRDVRGSGVGATPRLTVPTYAPAGLLEPPVILIVWAVAPALPLNLAALLSLESTIIVPFGTESRALPVPDIAADIVGLSRITPYPVWEIPRATVRAVT